MRRAGQAGFTLIEALAALAIVAALMAALATLAGQWMPHWRHGFVALQNADLVGLALDRIAEDVGAAEYARADGAQGAPLFIGEANAVAFVRAAIGANAGFQLEAVRIGETAVGAGVEIQRSHARFAPGAVGAFRDATPLLRTPFRITFAYAGPDGAWRGAWRNEAKLPRAVRVSVSAGATIATTAFPIKVTAAPEAASSSTAAGGGRRERSD